MSDLDRMARRADIRLNIAKTKEAQAMTRKAIIEATYFPFIVGIGFAGAVATATLALARLFGAG